MGVPSDRFSSDALPCSLSTSHVIIYRKKKTFPASYYTLLVQCRGMLSKLKSPTICWSPLLPLLVPTCVHAWYLQPTCSTVPGFVQAVTNAFAFAATTVSLFDKQNTYIVKLGSLIAPGSQAKELIGDIDSDRTWESTTDNTCRASSGPGSNESPERGGKHSAQGCRSGRSRMWSPCVFRNSDCSLSS